jgi:serine-type D-Ala-D-Ala carboxypeptidase
VSNFFSQQNKMLEKIFRNAISQGIFPGAASSVFQGLGSSRQGMISCYGSTSYEAGKLVDPATIYDLASLTKPLATLPALVSLMGAARINFSQKLEDLLQTKVPGDKREISLRDMMGHRAGLASYLPLFSLVDQKDPDQLKREVLRIILDHPLVHPPGRQALYSDLGYILAGFIVEKQSGQNLAEYLRAAIYEPLGLGDRLFFNPRGNIRAGVYARGEYCLWRQRLLDGEVSDENCALLGGVAGHAGLFGDIGAVSALVCFLLDNWLGQEIKEGKKPRLARDVLLSCFERQNQQNQDTWALGVDTPSSRHSSAGRYLSPRSIGHLGFTGTSFWIDPRRELVMVLLSNRVHPCRSNQKIKKFRPLFHDTVIGELETARESQ